MVVLFLFLGRRDEMCLGMAAILRCFHPPDWVGPSLPPPSKAQNRTFHYFEALWHPSPSCVLRASSPRRSDVPLRGDASCIARGSAAGGEELKFSSELPSGGTSLPQTGDQALGFIRNVYVYGR